MTVRVGITPTERTEDILFDIAIHDENGNQLYGTNTAILGVDVPPADGDGEMSFEFPTRAVARRHVSRSRSRSRGSTRERCTTGGSST